METPFIVGADGDFQGDLKANDAATSLAAGGDPEGPFVSNRSISEAVVVWLLLLLVVVMP